MNKPRIIKKYANRRLYDTAESRHVTLEGVRELLVGGEDVRIIDDTSGEDLTRPLLLQIIAEQEQGGRPILGEDLLAQIIRFYGHPMQDMMSEYLERSVDTFMAQQEEIQARLMETVAAGPLEAIQSMTSKNLELWSTLQQSLFSDRDPKRMGNKPPQKDPPED